MGFSLDLGRILTFFDIFVRKFEKKRSDLKKRVLSSKMDYRLFISGTILVPKIDQSTGKLQPKKTPETQSSQKLLFWHNLALPVAKTLNSNVFWDDFDSPGA